ncbi:hypothetical protein SAMN02194393_00199 [Maledivibacter halophilus]|uniref:Uncharacterized protein n=1 Tax=Maledivibacter halophilus TaxID=36842 RepID=A0A1T5IC76_9FIRM|nr:hypothetical protein SAMN02194393_00199 [Maledivibacter halophilus]
MDFDMTIYGGIYNLKNDDKKTYEETEELGSISINKE